MLFLEPYRLMLAYYYLSRIQFNAGNYTPSILSAHKAQKHAENIGNYFFLGLIYRGMAATYNRLHNAREEVSNCTLAHQCFLQAHTGYVLKCSGRSPAFLVSCFQPVSALLWIGCEG